MAQEDLLMPADALIKADLSQSEETHLDFDSVYTQYFDFVWRNLRRLGVPDPSLRDAAQEVFLVIYRRLGEFSPHGTLRSWVYSILRRVALAQKRKWLHDGTEAEAFETGRQTIAAVAADPETEAARSEALHFLSELLNALDDDKRDALVIVDLEGLTVPEACAALDVNLNTLYSRLRSAREEMREMLEHCDRDWRRR
jgi:RNA polymerase sigma-70 factor, ECF subfamily